MRIVATLLMLVLVAAIAMAGPETAPPEGSPLDFRGVALLAITVVVIAVESVRRLP